MSRSTKKYPGHRDRNPFMKNYANKRIRASPLLEIPSGNHYRKLTCSYNICDHSFMYYDCDTPQKYIQHRREFHAIFGIVIIPHETDDELIAEWHRMKSK